MKRFLLFILVIIWTGSSWAQVNTYDFASSAGSYTPLSTETVLWSASFDDQYSAAITIPTMTVAGTDYTTMFVTANGWITLGSGPTTYNYTPISQTTAYPVVISAFGRDLNHAASGTPKISYNTNDGGEIVIQYQDVRRYNQSGERLSFQIRLNPSNRNIRFVYGGTITSGTSTSYPQVGLRGATNAVYNNRTTTTNWAATTAGAINSATCTYSSTVLPAAGLTFTFSPPALLNPVSFTATPVSSSQINLAFTPSGGNNVIIVWDVDNTFSIPDGTPPEVNEPFAGGTLLYNGLVSPQLHTDLASNEDYHYMAYSYNGSVYSGGLYATTITFCDALTVFPYEQGFEGSWPPACWTDPITANYGWFKNTYGGSHSGTGWAYCNLANSEFFAPLMTIPPDCMFKFWYRVEGAGYPQNMAVKIGSDVIYQITGATNIDYQQVEISLAAYTGQTVAVSFLGQSGTGGAAWGICIDDIFIAPSSALEGYVYDFDGNPLAGATVNTNLISTLSGPDGYYLLSPIDPGIQGFNCSKTGYNYVYETIDILVGATITQNFILTNPEMTVAPGSIYAILESTETGSYNLEITNDGNGLLNFLATEISTASCEYTIELTDDYGDGWNGGTLDVLVNGAVVLDDITLQVGDAAGPKYWTFNVSTGDEITTMFSAGSYAYECIYKIFNDVMAEVYWAEGSDGPQDLPPGQLFGACDVEWLSLDIYAENVDPNGGTKTVVVTLDAAQTPPALAPGVTYTADIIFSCPIGIAPVTIPVTLVVTDAGLAGPQELKLFIVDQLTGNIKLKWNYIPLRDMEFTHFAIFKDDELIGTTTENLYLDINNEPGIYCYKVYAIYEGNVFSDPSNEVCVPYPLGPGVPVANWALLLGGLLMVSFVFIRFSKRS